MGSVYISRRKSYRPHPQPLPLKGGERLRIVLYGVCPCPYFFKSTHDSTFASWGVNAKLEYMILGAKVKEQPNFKIRPSCRLPVASLGTYWLRTVAVAPACTSCTTLHRPAPVPFHAFFCFTPLAGKSEPLMKKRRPLFFISGPLFFKSGPHRKKYGPLVKQYNYSASDNHPPNADAIPVQVVQAGASAPAEGGIKMHRQPMATYTVSGSEGTGETTFDMDVS